MRLNTNDNQLILQYSNLQKTLSFLIAIVLSTFFALIYFNSFSWGDGFSIWKCLELLLFGITLVLIGPFLFLLKWTEKLWLYPDRLESRIFWCKNGDIVYFKEFDRFRVERDSTSAKVKFIKSDNDDENRTITIMLSKGKVGEMIEYFENIGLINAFVEEQDTVYENIHNAVISDETLGYSEEKRIDEYDRYVSILNACNQLIYILILGLFVTSIYSPTVSQYFLPFVICVPMIIYLFVPASTVTSNLPVLQGVYEFCLVFISKCLLVLSLFGFLLLMRGFQWDSILVPALLISVISFFAFWKKYGRNVDTQKLKEENSITLSKVGTVIGSIIYGFCSVIIVSNV